MRTADLVMWTGAAVLLGLSGWLYRMARQIDRERIDWPRICGHVPDLEQLNFQRAEDALAGTRYFDITGREFTW